MHAELVLLRFVHVLGGTFWVGSGLFTAFFLIPSLASAPAHMGPVIAALQQRKLFVVLPAVAVLTIASGARLLWLTSGGKLLEYLSTSSGQAFALSGLAAVIAFGTTLLFKQPNARKVAAALLLFGAAGMGVARYL